MTTKQNVEALLAQGQTVQFAPSGISMYPLLDPARGDLVIVRPIERGRDRIRRGDVVVYRRDGRPGVYDANGFEQGILVVHRVWKADEETMYLLGDHQSKVEGPLRTKQVIGIMTARVRGGKTLRVESIPYRLSAGLWLMLRPFRMSILRAAKCLLRR